MLGDGECQAECLTSACDNDRGDCASLACSAGCYAYMIRDGICQENCKLEECQWDQEDCACSPGCTPLLMANSQCDVQCNTVACGFDNGKCENVHFDCALGCFQSMIGDGRCDEACNREDCRWDGLDCGCAPACNYNEIASCKPECLVPDCAYGELAGFQPCNDPVKRLTQRYFDMQSFCIMTVFPEERYDPVKTCMPSWTWETWNDIFYQCSPYVWYYSDNTRCLYNVGMCTNPTPTCERVAQFGCFQCVPGLVNLAGQCLLQCPLGTAPHPLVSDMCVPAPDSSSESTPVILHVNPTYEGNDCDGSWEKPYKLIDDTFKLWIFFYVKILLVGPRHSIGSSTPAYLPEVYDWPAATYRARSITISPYECEEQTICSRPTVLVNGSLRVTSSHLSDFYCREWKKPWSLHISNINFEENQANARPFPEFLGLGSGKLTLVKVTFSNFRNPTHLITFIANNHIHLQNVDFNDVMVTNSLFQADIEGYETINCRNRYFSASYGAANFTYENGRISYSQPVSTPLTFIRHIFMQTVLISNVTIAGLDCPAGCIFVDADSWAYLELRDSLFENNNMGPGFFLQVVSTEWKLVSEWEVPDVPSFVSKLNYNISSCTFRNNSFTTGAQLVFTYHALMQNLLFSNLHFQDSAAVLISIVSALPAVKQRIRGPVYLDPVTNQRTSFPPTLITLRAIQIVNCSSALSAPLRFFQVPYVIINVEIYSHQESDSCQPAVMVENSYNFTMEGSVLKGMKCGQGTAGLLVISSSGPVTLRNSSFSLISSNAEEGSVISISASHSIIMEKLLISQNKNKGCGAVFVSGLATASFRLSRSIQEMNIGGAFCLSNLAQVFIEASEFRYNNASTGGAIQLRASTSAATSFSIVKSSFEGNQADTQGGALYIFFSAPAVLLHLTIQDSAFHYNRGETGAVLFLSPQIQLQAPSYLSNVKIVNSHSKQGALALTHQSGTLALSSLTFEGNMGDSESCLYVLFSYSSGGYQNTLSIANSVFSNNTGRAIIRFPYSITGIHFLLDNVTLQNNTGVGLDLSNVLLDYTNSVTLRNTGTAVMLARYSKAVLRKVKFQDNQATVVQLVDQSALYCDFCEFTGTSNGGALQAESSSMVTLLSSTFRNNRDSDGSAVKLLMASASSLFNCSFVGNHATAKGTILLMSTSLLLTKCFFSRNTASKAAGLIAIESQVSLIGCQLENQSGTTGYFLFITSLSFVSLTNTTLAQGQSQEEGAIYVEESNITLANCQLTGITGRKGALIYAFGNANVTFQRTYVSTSAALDGLVYLWLSAGYFQDSNFSNYQGSAVTAQEASLLLANCSFTQGHAEEGAGLHCLNCLSSTLLGSEFAYLKAGKGGAVYIARGELAIRECSFAYNVANEGGAIFAQDVDLSISESVFTNNSALAYLPTESPGKGGAVVFGSSNSNYTLSILHSHFLRNKAEVKGGAIAWTGSLPSLQTLSFVDNFAPYGLNVSSFPIAILASSSYLRQSVSGQPYLSSLVFFLVDHYNQTVISDNSTKAGLTLFSANATVYGGTEVTASQGVLTFSDFSIAATPGTNVSLSAAVPELISLHNLTISIRLCEPGESLVEGKCLLCKAPKYSFSPADLCKDCLSEAICTGGAKVYPKAGYWRYDWLSTAFLQCPNSAACLGPAEEVSTCEGNSSCSNQLSPKGTCSEGYTGNMCQTCSLNYHRVSKIWCKPCPSHASSLALSIGYAIAVAIFSIFIVVTNIKSSRRHKSLHSVYLKVLMNYLQLVMLMGSFNLSWPTLMKELLNIQDSAGSFSEHLFSTDCLESDFDENEAFYTKLLLLSAAPITFFAISSLCWLLIAAIKRSVSVLKNDLIASGIILFFLLHPSVMRVMFGAFNCEEIQPGQYWVSSLLVRCWEGKHLTYALAVALPAIIIWGLGLPAVILGNLIMHRKKLKDRSVQKRFGFMIKGYSESRYFWEFIIIYRKLLIIAIATFLSRIAKMTQALIALSVLVFSLALQHRNQPYSHPSLNTMEYRSIIVSIATIFFGLYYLDSSLSEFWQYFFFGVTLGVNLYFLQFWLRSILATCVVMAVNKISWLKAHFVAINEVSVVSNKTFLKRMKSSLEASKLAMARALPKLGKELYLGKLMQQ